MLMTLVVGLMMMILASTNDKGEPNHFLSRLLYVLFGVQIESYNFDKKNILPSVLSNDFEM